VLLIQVLHEQKQNRIDAKIDVDAILVAMTEKYKTKIVPLTE
jgi:hypothetical protein